MSLNFVLGTASKDHNAILVEQVDKIRQQDKDAKIFYLVPNHIKFASEVGLLNSLRVKNTSQELFATSELQILSFSRLAWYFMKNDPIYQTRRLSQAGANMLVYKILRENEADLTIFKSEQTQFGFITKLAKQLNDLKIGLVTSKDLKNSQEQLLKNNSKEYDLLAKLHDLSIVYADYEKKTQGKYLGSADLLDALAKKLETIDLSHSYFIIDGFSQFNAGEYQILNALLQGAKQVTVSLVLDKKHLEEPQTNDIFYRSGLVYYRLTQLARQNNVPILFDTRAKEDRVDQDLVELENYWIAKDQAKYAPSTKLSGNIKVIEATDRLEEVKYIAAKIRQLVLLEGYRYKDFLIMTRHLTPYKNILQPILKQFCIPAFLDLEKKMVDHPLVELLNALFLVEKRGYRYDDIMRLLKTELLIPKDPDSGEYITRKDYRHKLALAENQVLKYGYRKKGWLGEPWVYYRFGTSDLGNARTENEEQITKEINFIKDYVASLLPNFYARFKRAKTGKEVASALVDFLVKAGVVDQLQQWREETLNEGQVDHSTREEQVWSTFCDLLDEYVEILGDEPVETADFLELIKAGFEGATYSQVPTTLDQVVISESGMAQPNDKKIVIILGATDLVMPDMISNEDMLSDHDKSLLKDTLQEGSYLPDDNEHVLANEPFLNYLAFLAPTDKLYLSYPLSDEKQAEYKCSPYVEQLRKNLELETIKVAKNDGTSDPLNYLGTKRSTLSELIQVERQALNDGVTELSGVWRYLYQKFNQDLEYSELFKRLNQGLDYKNIPENLTKENVEQLYGKELKVSISRLEDFYADPYEYFLKHGLGLRKRDVYEVSAIDKGNYFHAVLDTFFKLLLRDNKDIKHLSKKDFDSYFLNAVSQTKQLAQFKILESSNRMKFLAKQLNGAVHQVTSAIRNQRQTTDLKTIKTEVLFGHIGNQNGLDALRFTTPKDRIVTVRGRIDRIDELVLEDKHYLNLVDYKSSKHKFDYAKAYYGLTLQLLTYLDALLKNKTKLVENVAKDDITPAGALYMQVYDPRLPVKDVYNKDLDKVLLAKNKYEGLLVKDLDVIQKLDEELAPSSSSLRYPVSMTKNGAFRQSDSLITLEDLTAMIEHNEELIKQATDMIFDGKLDIKPALYDNEDSLTHSQYRSILQFDPMLPENNYYRVPKLKKQEIIDLLNEKGTDNV